MASHAWSAAQVSRAAIGLLLFAGIACAPAAPSAAPSAQQAPAAGGASAAAQPAAAPSEWDRIVAAAKQEGTVSVIGPHTSDSRDALTEGFQKRYPEIRIEYEGLGAPEIAPKVLREREGARNLRDVLISGNSAVLPLIRASAVEPLPAYLKGPEGTNTSKWRGGRLDYSDTAGQYNVTVTDLTAPTITYHPASVAPGEIKSYRDLLDPKWRGKLVLQDPRVPGAGQAMIAFIYATDSLGKDYLRQFFAQNPVLSRDDRQITDWIIRGNYAVQLSGAQLVAAELRSKGIEVGMLGDADIAEGSYLTSGSGSIAVFGQPPHPNATMVYLDWLLSQDAQYAFAKSIGYVSRRTDVPTDHAPDFLVPRPGKTYMELFRQEALEQRDDVVEYLRSLLGG